MLWSLLPRNIPKAECLHLHVQHFLPLDTSRAQFWSHLTTSHSTEPSQNQTSSSCVILGWYLTFLRIILTTQGEILHRASEWCCYLNRPVVSFSPSFVPAALWPSPALWRSRVSSLMSFDSFLVVPMVWMEEAGSVTGVFYTHDELQLGVHSLKGQD